jgi:hypothetical protein
VEAGGFAPPAFLCFVGTKCFAAGIGNKVRTEAKDDRRQGDIADASLCLLKRLQKASLVG